MKNQKLIGVAKYGNIQEEFYMESSNRLMSIDASDTDTVTITKVIKVIPEPIPKRIVFSEHLLNDIYEKSIRDLRYKTINGMKVEYCDMGIYINKITLKKQQLTEVLKMLDDNCSQVGRVTLVIDKKNIHIYHHSCSGYKRPTKQYFENKEYDQAMSFACGRSKGIKRVQYFKSLQSQITKLLK
jgi:hypothetical protein